MQDKKTLITIIVLLVIFLPLAIVGTYRHVTKDDSVIVDDNPNHDLIYNGKLYFYYGNRLLGTYECSNCKQVETSIDDTNYHTNSYRIGTYNLPVVISENLALFNQDGTDYIYSISVGRTISSLVAIKDYKIMHTEQVLITKNSSGWGIASISENGMLPIVGNLYDYISLPAHLINGLLDTSRIIALRNGTWYVLNKNDTTDYRTFDVEIVDFNDNYYITYNNGYHIIDGTHKEYLATVTKNAAYAAGEYILIIDNDNNLLVYRDCNEEALQTIELPNYETIYFNQTDAGVEILIDGNLYQTIETS